jgi:hypothetical protein
MSPRHSRLHRKWMVVRDEMKALGHRPQQAAKAPLSQNGPFEAHRGVREFRPSLEVHCNMFGLHRAPRRAAINRNLWPGAGGASRPECRGGEVKIV